MEINITFSVNFPSKASHYVLPENAENMWERRLWRQRALFTSLYYTMFYGLAKRKKILAEIVGTKLFEITIVHLALILHKK